MTATAQALSDIANHLAIGTMTPQQASRALQAYVEPVDHLETKAEELRKIGENVWSAQCILERSVQKLRVAVGMKPTTVVSNDRSQPHAEDKA